MWRFLGRDPCGWVPKSYPVFKITSATNSKKTQANQAIAGTYENDDMMLLANCVYDEFVLHNRRDNRIDSIGSFDGKVPMCSYDWGFEGLPVSFLHSQEKNPFRCLANEAIWS